MGFGGMGAGRRVGAMGIPLGGAGVSYDPAALAIFAAFTTPPTSAWKTIINNRVVALKAAGIWSLLDVDYGLAAADAQSALVNWKSPGTFDGLTVNSPSFVASRGFTGDGSSSRIRTQFTPSVNGVNFTKDSASMWVWSLTNVALANADIGSTTAPRASLNSLNGTAQSTLTINDGTVSVVSNASSIGSFGGQRISSAAKQIWKNGAQVGSDLAVSSTALASQEQWVCGANGVQFSSRQIAMASWAASLQGKELAFYNINLAYLQAIGAA